MDDSPKPLKEMKPTRKYLNSAEQFQLANQMEYENRSKPSMDSVNRVERHNLAYPKLKDELDRRRSVGQVKTPHGNNRSRYPKCKACIRLKQLAKLQKQNIKPKCKTRRSKKDKRDRNSRVKKSRIKKYGIKSKYQQKYGRCNCCIPVEDKYTGMDIDIHPIDGILSKSKTSGKKSEKNSASHSVDTLKSPDTSDPSISSYNTFPSMDHEPMVSMDH